MKSSFLPPKMSKQQSKIPEPGIHIVSLLSPMMISTAAPSAAAMSRHNPNDRAAHTPAPPGGTPMLYSKVSSRNYTTIPTATATQNGQCASACVCAIEIIFVKSI